MPAGPLRESTQRLKTVDFVINNGAANEISEDYFKITLNEIYQINNPQKITTLQSLAGQRVHAVAGIGDPQRFFQQLNNAGIQIIEHAFPDHYAYRQADLNFNDHLPILMTEKDAIKCRDFVDDRYWCMPINFEVPQNLQNKLLKQLSSLR